MTYISEYFYSNCLIEAIKAKIRPGIIFLKKVLRNFPCIIADIQEKFL